jgi:hypothetical protein
MFIDDEPARMTDELWAQILGRTSGKARLAATLVLGKDPFEMFNTDRPDIAMPGEMIDEEDLLLLVDEVDIAEDDDEDDDDTLWDDEPEDDEPEDDDDEDLDDYDQD